MASGKNPRKIPWILILVFCLLALGIGGAGYLHFQHREGMIKRQKQNELLAIARLKSGQIVNWQKGRVADVKVAMEAPFLAQRVREWLANESSGGKDEILKWMRALVTHYDYMSAFLLDPHGRVRLSVSPEGEKVGPLAQESASRAVRSGVMEFSDFHPGETPGDIHIDLLAPLLLQEGGQPQAAAVLLLRVDPHRFLFPLIQSWPTDSETAETLLVRREGDEVVFLNELRHRKNTALTLRVPVTEQMLPAAMAARGETGVVEGLDYRKVEVLAAVVPVPNTPWFLVAKVDTAEVYAPLSRNRQLIAIVVIAFIGVAGIIVILIWQRQWTQAQLRQYEGELEHRALTAHFEYLTKYANDIILLANYGGRIIEANERAVHAYGYSADEMKRMNLRDLRTPETRGDFDRRSREVEEGSGLVFETTHQRRGGETFPVEVSSRVIEIEGRKFYQSIIRDITERKHAEWEIRRLNAELEQRVKERTAELSRANQLLQAEIAERRQAEEETLRRNRELSVLYAISESIAHSLAPEETLSRALESILDRLEIDGGGIYLLGEDEKTMTLSVIRGFSPEFIEKVKLIRLGVGISGRALAEHRPVIMDVEDYPETQLAAAADREGLRVVASVPILSLSHSIGALNLGLRRKRWFSPQELDLLTAIGQLLGNAVVKARLFEMVQQELSERRRGEENLQRRTLELQAINEELEAFSYSVSHDLRSPLRAIDGFSQALLEDYAGRLDDQGQDYLQRVRAASQRMDSLIDDLLVLSRLTRREMEYGEVDLSSMAGELARQLLDRHPEKRVEWVISPGLTAKGDKRLIKIAIENLLSNAWKFTGTKNRGKIEFGEIRKGDERVYFVRDDGVGFDMAYAGKLFTPFQRLHRSSEFPGTGIGLATVRRVIHRHGGRVWAEGEVEKGATFYFTLGK